MQININDERRFDLLFDNNQWQLNGKSSTTDIQWLANGQASILHNNKSYMAQLEKIDVENKELVLNINGQPYQVAIKEDIDLLLARMGINMAASHKAAPLKAPMPGLVLKVLVAVGQQVNKGDSLLILEAMKMENVLKATGPGTVKSINISEKTAVEKGTVLIEME